MKTILVLLTSLATLALSLTANSQCTTANLNWDNLDFLVSTGNYATFVTDARTRDQRFMVGETNVRFQVSTGITIVGENSSFTGTTGSNASGASAVFTTTTTANTTITLTFDTVVSNVRFSLLDFDNRQRVDVTSFLGGVPVITTLANATGSSGTTFSGNPGTSPRADGINGDYASNDNRSAVNVTVTLPVTSIVLTISRDAGSFAISDLSACVTGGFTTNYRVGAQPWPGQASYIMATPDTNMVHRLNPFTGAAVPLFTEPAAQFVNGMGYDPYRHNLYYVLDDINPSVTQRGLKKYDFNTETIVNIATDITTLGIPVYSQGVESAAASFYDSCLYLGIEGGNTSFNSSRESAVWRIAFDAAGNITTVSQVYAAPADNGTGTNTHDWGDILIKDGILYDWNRGNQGSTRGILNYNLQTQTITASYSAGATSFVPSQVSETWDGRLFQILNYSVQYNGTGGTTGTMSTISGPSWVGASGDASEAFKPKADFGDAPASYDPAGAPAVNEMDTALRLGATIDREWLKTGANVAANSDGADEDGIASPSLLCPCSGNYPARISVYNNTGADATLIAWLDYNGNGLFDAAESRTVTVPSSTATQIINLLWNNAVTTLPNLSNTYLRVRITSAANGMTTANASGYFLNGETEDYRIVVNAYPLADELFNFTVAKNTPASAKLSWTNREEPTLINYLVQQSTNGDQWNTISNQTASGKTATQQYNVVHNQTPSTGVYYRLQLNYTDGVTKLSPVRHLQFSGNEKSLVSPNPATTTTSLQFTSAEAGTELLIVRNAAGAVVAQQQVYISKGSNVIPVAVARLATGTYSIELKIKAVLVKEQFIKL